MTTIPLNSPAPASLHVNLITPETTEDRSPSSPTSSLSDNAHPLIQRKLRMVSIRPSVQFPTDRIFQIAQCLDDTAIAAAAATAPPEKSPQTTASTVQSSVVTTQAGDFGQHPYYIDDLGEFGDTVPPTPITALGDLVELPIAAQLRPMLCFDETLVVSVDLSEAKKPTSGGRRCSTSSTASAAAAVHPLLADLDRLRHLGGMTIRISGASDSDQFVIHSSSQFTHPTLPAAVTASIVATVDSRLAVLKERRTEAICSRDQRKDEVYLNCKRNLAGDHFALQSIRSEAGECRRRSGQLLVAAAPNFVLDGAGFLLMRYMVLEQFVGRLHTTGMYVTGELCRSTYCFSRKANVLVNNRLCTVVKVRRSCWRSGAADSQPDLSVSVYLETGHLVRHTWHECAAVVHLCSEQDVNAMMAAVPQSASGVDRRWREDVELFERYLDARNDRMVDLRAWMGRSWQVQALLRDYVYCVLQTKPRNVLEYTVRHFGGAKVEYEYTVVAAAEAAATEAERGRKDG